MKFSTIHRKPLHYILILGLGALFSCAGNPPSSEVTTSVPAERWSIEQANDWAKQMGWLRGSNFTPSSAINQLEFWQEETFDSETINRELGWAADIGLNCMRVYLHHLAWEVDSSGFKKRVKEYLTIADSHQIKTIFVFFDDCWNPTYEAGKQPEPKIGIHNSGWVRDPGELLYTDSTLTPKLEIYVKDLLSTFKNDTRIALWDLYNEPGNSGYGNKSMPLLTSVFSWAREINPSQPISVGVWADLPELNDFQLANSDIITYHNYSDYDNHRTLIDSLQLLGRPMVCTEYMARKFNSTFQSIMPLLKDRHVGAINWGLVDGKTNTKYAWGDPIPDGSEPPLWFHEIFRKDGTPYSEEEVETIKNLTN